MHDENIEKIFNMDIREKKRIGSNIFKRVSTRKGGSYMYSMRVPTKKELRELNGKVTTFNLNTILPIEEFNQKSLDDRKQLMDYWREHYKSKEIMDVMGISKNVFYKLLRDIGIEPEHSHARNNTSERVRLNEDEMKEIIGDKENFYDFDLFKMISSDQQNEIFEEYFNRCGKNTSSLVRKWEGSNSGYLYYVKSRIDKKKKQEKKEVEQISFEEKSVAISQPPKEEAKENIEENIEPILEVIEPVKEEVTETIKVEPKEALKDQHTVDVIMEKPNAFSYSLKGVYNKEAIIRRMKLLLEEIEDSEESLTVEINIKS